jgi:hypothetical protein
MTRFVAIALAMLAGCATVAPRFPTDVQTAIAHDDMRRLETDRFIIYFPASRRALVDRFLVRADRCAQALHDYALIKRLSKIVVVMPDVPFNNAFVAPEALGYEQVSVIPAYSTLDFATAFGLPPDPGAIACHELVHYVHFQQNAGFWGTFNRWFGPTYTPQLGYDPWFDEGLATHYEARLEPGLGRPVWPIFTGTFAAAYAGRGIGGGDLSSYGRNAAVGHHYLVGSMFVRFLAERYGERPLWVTIEKQAHAFTGWFFTGTFEHGFGVSFGNLLDEFEDWVHRTFPVRTRPPAQRALGLIGNDARYGRGRDGTEAWVAEDVDSPPRLTVRDAAGHTLLDTALVEVVPPRTLAMADPLLTSGLSITADGREVWLTTIDLGATFQVTRLLRWRRGESGLTEVARDLGPGLAIDPSGRTYYYAEVDGDRWSLAAFDVTTRARRTIVDMRPGTYVVRAQPSPDGKRLAASVWDGTAFVIWIVDTATGSVVQRIKGAGTPVFDARYTADGRLVYLGVVQDRFQVFIGGQRVTDAPYAVLAAREANGNIRFLDREHWSWELAEVALPAAPQPEPEPQPQWLPQASPEQQPQPPPRPPAPTAPPLPPATAQQLLYPSTPIATPPSSTVTVLSDRPYSAFDHLFVPTVRAPTLVVVAPMPHVGVVLGGADRLDLQRWSLAGFVQPGTDDGPAHYGATAAYTNNMLAPVFVTAQGGFLDWVAPVADETDPMITYDEEHRTRDASLLVGYTYRGTLAAAVGGQYTDDEEQLEMLPRLRRYLGGPAAQLSWYSAESTRYTGPRRALRIDGQLGYFPRDLSSFDGDIVDVGGTVGTTLPLPIGRRHTIRAFVRARSLMASEDTGLLQIGGDSALGLLWSRSNKMAPPDFDATRFPPNLRFVEPLRGFEDFALSGDRVKIGELSWRYPLIIDRGLASTLWVLPASYLRELDLELFGTAAIVDANDRHYAVGGAIGLRLEFLRVPLVVMYQLARRLSDDQGLSQFVGIGPDL